MIVFFGLAGSGKSVQSDKLSELIGWRHVSAGQLLRAYNDEQVQADLLAGNLVDYNITNGLMRQVINEAQGKIILDGYPRQMEQARWLIEEKLPIELGIVLEVSPEVIKQRLAIRGRHDDSMEAIERRLEIFNTQTKEVIDFFLANGVKIIKINGAASIDEVHAQIAQEVQHVLASN